ncbi:hypothetical protein [Speluncibacter jeojiensis]|uniref:Uncharacterized protein n=1 Tax=Speluncibacter jeojiensis TaxID=2710754 RepID=A0A9X4LYB4_9ACTN|nr:hypothetical protein [Corynebacteriales bacterium D3-21]
MGTEIRVRPESIEVDEVARRRVLRRIAAEGARCHHCGGTDFVVGRALYLGFLFLDEDTDAYLVALTCTDPDCPRPHTGIRLRGEQFLDDGHHST